MGIIFTKNQLRLLKESDDRTNMYIAKLKNITKELNKIYSQISFVTIAELIKEEVKIDSFYDAVNNLEKLNSNLRDEFNAFFESFDEDTYYAKWETFHDYMEDLYYNNLAKITSLSSIFNTLDNLVHDNEHHNEAFPDEDTINIG